MTPEENIAIHEEVKRWGHSTVTRKTVGGEFKGIYTLFCDGKVHVRLTTDPMRVRSTAKRHATKLGDEYFKREVLPDIRKRHPKWNLMG